MNPTVLKEYTYQLIQKRNFAYMVVGVLSLLSLFQGIALMSKEQKVILIPQYDLDRRIVFEGDKIADEYLVDWSSSLLVSLLTVNPQTVHRKVKDFLKVSISSQELTKLLSKQAKAIERDRISTVFYPTSFHADQKNKEIKVSGTFMAYIGSDKNPVIQQKTYRLGYMVLANGLIAVSKLKEEENE